MASKNADVIIAYKKIVLLLTSATRNVFLAIRKISSAATYASAKSAIKSVPVDT